MSGNVCLAELRGDDGAVASALAYGYGGRIGAGTAVHRWSVFYNDC
jgi:hypothetical protein